MSSKNIGLFFGSFNPVHHGHLMIANYLAEFWELDQVWFVISPQNPFKKDADLLPDYQRREILMRAVGDFPKFRVSSVEFKLPKPSYTIDTLHHLSTAYPDKNFSLIMGSDQLADFHRWKNPEEILKNFPVLVYPRPGIQTEDSSSAYSQDTRFRYIEAPMMEISSSFIRESIKNGKDVRFYLPDLSWQYIEEMHFYR